MIAREAIRGDAAELVTPDRGRHLARLRASATGSTGSTPRRNYHDPMDITIHASLLPQTDRTYGIRDCAVRNPAGNLIGINELR